MARPQGSAHASWSTSQNRRFLIGSSKVRVQLEGVPFSVPTEICIERTPCPFGGTRPWLRCRTCNSRRSILYGLDEDGSFSCRKCMGLFYSSQDETKMKRLWRKQNRIEAKLAGRYRCARPKGMHWKTFRRISGDLNTGSKCSSTYTPRVHGNYSTGTAGRATSGMIRSLGS